MWSNSCQLHRTWGLCCVWEHIQHSTHTYPHALKHTVIHSHTYPQTHRQHMNKYTYMHVKNTHIGIHKHVPKHTSATLKKIPLQWPSWRHGGGEGNEGEWGFAHEDDDDLNWIQTVVCLLVMLHNHMLSFGEVFLQTDWLDRSSSFSFFLSFHCVTDRALGSDYCQATNSSHWPTSSWYSRPACHTLHIKNNWLSFIHFMFGPQKI